MKKALVSGLLTLCTGTVALKAYTWLVRPWLHSWGATDEEVHRTLPGDDQVPHADTEWTRAITVKAKAAEIVRVDPVQFCDNARQRNGFVDIELRRKRVMRQHGNRHCEQPENH